MREIVGIAMHSTNVFFSDAQIAERYSISRPTVWRWAADDKSDFPKPIKISAGCTRWRLDDLERFDAERAAGNNNGLNPAQRARAEIEGDKPKSQTAAPATQQRRAKKPKPVKKSRRAAG